MDLAKLKLQIAEIAQGCGRNPSDIQLVAVSKGRPIEAIEEAHAQGQRLFGENRVPEALEKQEALPADIEWHFIGNLQTKKIPKVIGRFGLIHSVDTPELARKIASYDIQTPILLQVNTSGEATKHGSTPDEWLAVFDELLQLENLKIEGLMTMAPLTDNEATIRQCFADLRNFRDRIEHTYKTRHPHLSMGMSNDYKIAIEEGATLLRIGSALFA